MSTYTDTIKEGRRLRIDDVWTVRLLSKQGLTLGQIQDWMRLTAMQVHIILIFCQGLHGETAVLRRLRSLQHMYGLEAYRTLRRQAQFRRAQRLGLLRSPDAHR